MFREIRTAQPTHTVDTVAWHLAGVSADGNYTQALALGSRRPPRHRYRRRETVAA
ncbi:hypothetical protein [Embleya scabrispora]|uniref:hypothetical protein n=1 Tax=Embleya scabrispora TaxID=159449 RepID=UPI00131A4462|nr:hypothetical protein [Embleya scabrispora]MYS81615.1 hypothetical protein [Streptomyces sp. SID5474]